MFLNSIIIKSFALLFFNNNRENFGNLDKIKYIFNFITLNIIILIVTIIRYAIDKFKYNFKYTIKFKNYIINNITFHYS